MVRVVRRREWVGEGLMRSENEEWYWRIVMVSVGSWDGLEVLEGLGGGVSEGGRQT